MEARPAVCTAFLRIRNMAIKTRQHYSGNVSLIVTGNGMVY